MHAVLYATLVAGLLQDPSTAESSAHAAVTAAHVANQVASHAKVMHEHARQALEHAHSALNGAQQNTEGLTEAQQESLHKADLELEKATQKVETEQLKSVDWMHDVEAEVDAAEQSRAVTARLEEQIAELRAKMAASAASAELEAELKTLEGQLGDAHDAEDRSEGAGESLGKLSDELEQLQRQLDTMEDIKNLNRKLTGMDADVTEEQELRASSTDIEGLLHDLEAAKDRGEPIEQAPLNELGKELQKLKKAVSESIARQEAALKAAQAAHADFTPVQVGAVPPPVAPAHTPGGTLEINTEMPYGELEPFGREDTAQELTDASIRESDQMVDQIEKAEIAEEKRAVFRSLTRLRGAAITSFDGVARSQTGNIDEYAHTHQWRGTHPLHHLADEEADVSKWAFPKNAD